MARAPCLHTNMKLYTLTGLYNASPDTRWLNRLIYVLWSVFYVSLLTNLTIVLTQSARGQRDLGGAEVFQQCFEVLVAIIVFIDLRVFLSRVHPLLGHMQRMFDKSYPDIQAKCQTAERRIVIYMSGFVFAGALYCYVKRMIFGMTENERKLSANSHNKANPEKQLPFLLWLPVDDTVSPMYYVTLAYNVLFTVVSAVMTYHLITYLPIICVHMQGSCETIARSLTQLGNLRTDHTTRDDLDRNGASKSRRNEIPLDLVHGTQMGPRRERINQSEHDSQIDHALNITSVNSASKLRRYSDPALSSLIAIIIQHQQFLLIRNQLQAAIQRSLLLKNFAYNIILTVSLYQLNSVDFADKDRFLQMIIQYLLMIAMSFSFTQSSELLDRGNDAIHEALTCGAWYNMRARVARLLIPMIRVSGRPKRLMYFAGTVDISYRSFVAVLKFSYSFFALLKNVI